MCWTALISLTFISSAIASDIYDSATCGTPTPSFVRMIRGGDKVAAGELPWSVYFFTSPFNHCSGTLISRKHVLTAAHCVEKKKHSKQDLETFGVRMVGLCGSPHCSKAFLRKVVSVSMHEKYYNSRKQTYDDIALLELEIPVPVYVHHICLPTSEFRIDEVHDDIFVSGIGEQWRGDPNLTLKKVVLGKRSEITSHGEFIVDGEGRKAICAGDSGGGATSVINGRQVLVGISVRGSCHEEFTRSSSDFTDVPQRLAEIKRRIGLH